ncbi:prepilin-type N-terminal cleavage/methylation domain-containing protein [Oryzibacter oryziterrae]|uniref:prepilin-type N-terminal cleavage/methylation domain-containing protein n=1 Tax=Oryzibacter oryziterrae TaxID=2766474 RepID=UPI001F394E7B|nr:prepilin-type N-terminal cleavage/methylation domain-containing protein [Oryzibacter oryziterrae]
MLATGRSNDGFTLLEVLVTMTLLALVGAGTSVIVWSYGDRMEMERTVSRISALLSAARHDAKASNTTAVVSFDAKDRTFSLEPGNRKVSVPEGISVKVLGARDHLQGADQPAILFLGGGSSAGGVINFATSADRSQLRVDWLTGRIDEDAQTQ